MHLILPLLILLTSSPKEEAHLKSHQWKNRVLLIWAPPASKLAAAQNKIWESHRSGLKERDIVLAKVGNGRVYWPDFEESAAWYNEHFKLAGDAFCVILIGKDGTEKLRTFEVLDAARLFAVIDVMPMRRQEMRQRK